MIPDGGIRMAKGAGADPNDPLTRRFWDALLVNLSIVSFKPG